MNTIKNEELKVLELAKLNLETYKGSTHTDITVMGERRSDSTLCIAKTSSKNHNQDVYVEVVIMNEISKKVTSHAVIYGKDTLSGERNREYTVSHDDEEASMGYDMPYCNIYRSSGANRLTEPKSLTELVKEMLDADPINESDSRLILELH